MEARGIDSFGDEVTRIFELPMMDFGMEFQNVGGIVHVVNQ